MLAHAAGVHAASQREAAYANIAAPSVQQYLAPAERALRRAVELDAGAVEYERELAACLKLIAKSKN